MFVVTVSFKNCPHQVVLRYKTEESMKAAASAERTEEHTTETREDDFGVTAAWRHNEVASVIRVDLSASLKGRNTEDKIRARAAVDLKQELINDPALEFLVERAPIFGSK